jgi:hypothetical protein
MESVYKHCHFHRPVFWWRNCWAEHVEPFCMTRRGNGAERQAQPRRIEHGLCLDICPSIRAIFTRLATASAVLTQHLVTIWKKKILFVSVERTLICTNWHYPGPQSHTGVNKNYFAFRRLQFRFLPMRSATLSRILMHLFPSPFYVHLKREDSFFSKVILRRHLYIWLYINYATDKCH